MKAIYLTSNVGSYQKVNGKMVSTPMNNENGFVDNLKKDLPEEINFTFVASSPSKVEITDMFATLVKQAFELDGFVVKEFNVIHDGFKGDIAKTILNSDVVFLSGGHVGTQNQFFKDIKLSYVLLKYKGVLIGQSAGSMNSSVEVYDQPVTEEEFYDPNFKVLKKGLGLTNIKVMPHMNMAKEEELCGMTTYELCLKDSKTIPHYGIVDGGYIKIVDNKACAYGPTTYFYDGKETIICKQNAKKML